MRDFMLVGAGGFLGATLRYAVSLGMVRWSGSFPFATLTINIVGCFLIGLVMPAVEGRPGWLLFLVPGILGGFTTFSAFGHESWKLVQNGTPVLAGVYVTASVTFGLAAVWLGRLMSPILK